MATYELTQNTETVLFNSNNCTEVFYNGAKIWPTSSIVFNKDTYIGSAENYAEVYFEATVNNVATVPAITFTSLNPDVAKVDYSYVASNKSGCYVKHLETDGAGECLIKATTATGLTAYYKLIFWDVKLNGSRYTFYNFPTTISCDEEVTVTAEVVPSTYTYSWSYVDRDNAYTVLPTTDDKLFKFKSSPNASNYFTVTLTVPGCGTWKREYITAGIYKNITVTPDTMTLKATGNTGNVTYQTTPEDTGDDTVTWISSDTNVATVGAISRTNRAIVTSVNPGTCSVKAVSGVRGVFGECVVTVEPAVKPTAIQINGGNITFDLTYTNSRSKTLGIIATPYDATDYTVTYTSSNPAIAKVSGNTLTAVAVGTCTVTATTDNGLTSTITVNVIQSTVNDTITSISLNGPTASSSYYATRLALDISPYSVVENRTFTSQWTYDSAFEASTAAMAIELNPINKTGTVTGNVTVKVTDLINNKVFTKTATVTFVNGVCTKVVI